MSKKGGYQILDFKNTVFNIDEGVSFPGYFNIILNIKKPILLSGIKFMGFTINDFYCFPFPFTNDTSNITAFIFMIPNPEGTLVLSVGDDDVVTIQQF